MNLNPQACGVVTCAWVALHRNLHCISHLPPAPCTCTRTRTCSRPRAIDSNNVAHSTALDRPTASQSFGSFLLGVVALSRHCWNRKLGSKPRSRASKVAEIEPIQPTASIVSQCCLLPHQKPGAQSWGT